MIWKSVHRIIGHPFSLSYHLPWPTSLGHFQVGDLGKCFSRQMLQEKFWTQWYQKNKAEVRPWTKHMGMRWKYAWGKSSEAHQFEDQIIPPWSSLKDKLLDTSVCEAPIKNHYNLAILLWNIQVSKPYRRSSIIFFYVCHF